MPEYTVIGKPVPQKGSNEKATGEVKYVNDIVLPLMLYGKILTSPYPHARILNIDTTKAEKLPGVKAVVTGKDTNGKLYGFMKGGRDKHLLAIDKVRFIGDEVAAVAATDEDIAEEALDLIEVEYEELPAVFDAVEALKEGAPQIHDHAERNICFYRHFDLGDVEKGFAESDYVREDRFTIPIMTHGFIEPNGCVAQYNTSGNLTVWASTQMVFMLRRDLSYTLDVPYNKVRVIAPWVGAGFGGKGNLLSLEFCTCLLAIKSGRPVKIIYTKEEQFVNTTRRLPMTIDLKTGVKKDGTLMAHSAKVISNGGAHAHGGAITIYNTALALTLAYRVPNVQYDAYRVYTNTPMAGPMQGHGQVHSRYAADCQLDMICEDLGLDPVEVRLKNALRSGDETALECKITSCGLTEGIEKAVERSGWREKRGKRNGRGVGMGCGGFVAGTKISQLSDSSAIVKLNEDGTAIVLSGGTDIGQGIPTMVAQITAEVLGLRLEDVSVIWADTGTCPFDPGSFSSRVTFYHGNAVKRAAEDVRNQLVKEAGFKLLTNPENIAFRDRFVYVKDSPERRMPLAELVRTAQTSAVGGVIIGKASYFPPGSQWPDPKRSYKGNTAGTYSFYATVAEVEVDMETGEVKLVKVTSGDDCGQPLNPLAVSGQSHGNISMHHGQVLLEEFKMERGKLLNPNLVDYKMPTTMNTPEMEVIHIITNDSEGPFGAKEAGEGSSLSVVGAIGNAIHDATGVWVKDLPITPEKLLKAIKEKEKEEKAAGKDKP